MSDTEKIAAYSKMSRKELANLLVEEQNKNALSGMWHVSQPDYFKPPFYPSCDPHFGVDISGNTGSVTGEGYNPLTYTIN